MHFPSMKVILKNDEGNHFRIDSKRGRERRIVYGLMRRILQRCGRFSLFFFVGPERICFAILQKDSGKRADL